MITSSEIILNWVRSLGEVKVRTASWRTTVGGVCVWRSADCICSIKITGCRVGMKDDMLFSLLQVSELKWFWNCYFKVKWQNIFSGHKMKWMLICSFRSFPLCSRGRTPWHSEAVQPQGQHHQHLPRFRAQQPKLLLQTGGGGRWLQQWAVRYL